MAIGGDTNNNRVMRSFLAVVALIATALAATASRADEINDDIALFEQLCVANMPNLEPIRARATAEHWAPLDASALRPPLSSSPVRLTEGWSADVNGVRYTVRIGSGRSKLRGMNEDGSQRGMTDSPVARCSVETPRGDGRELLLRLEQKHGKARSSYTSLLTPGATEWDAEWRVNLRDLDLVLYLFRPKTEQAPGARMEIALNPDPFASK